MDNTIQINKFYIAYEKLMEDKDEQQFVISLSEITQEITPTNFNNMENIKGLIFNLEKQKFLFSYKMLLLSYIKFCFCEKMINLFDNTDFIFTVEIVVNKINKLKEYSTYIDSFKTVPMFVTSVSESNSPISSTNVETKQNTSTKNDKWSNAWYTETRIDIINRFFYLRQYFGLDQLTKFKIKNITYEEVCSMNFKKLAKYHNKIIGKIKKEIKKNIQLCNVFLEVEEQLVMSMITSNSSLELNNFSLEIEFGDDDEIDLNSDMENNIDSHDLKLAIDTDDVQIEFNETSKGIEEFEEIELLDEEL